MFNGHECQVAPAHATLFMLLAPHFVRALLPPGLTAWKTCRRLTTDHWPRSATDVGQEDGPGTGRLDLTCRARRSSSDSEVRPRRLHCPPTHHSIKSRPRCPACYDPAPACDSAVVRARGVCLPPSPHQQRTQRACLCMQMANLQRRT